jgi:hypothetical protein
MTKKHNYLLFPILGMHHHHHHHHLYYPFILTTFDWVSLHCIALASLAYCLRRGVVVVGWKHEEDIDQQLSPKINHNINHLHLLSHKFLTNY